MNFLEQIFSLSIISETRHVTELFSAGERVKVSSIKEIQLYKLHSEPEQPIPMGVLEIYRPGSGRAGNTK
jgi:hypothetical protein